MTAPRTEAAWQDGSVRRPLGFATILDLTDEAGVQGARLLAELGARVIRVESSEGDAIRRRPPFVAGLPGLERSLSHLLYNAGKQSVALSMNAPEAWDAIDLLAGRADVVLAPLVKSPLARRFFDGDRLQEMHPGIGVVALCFRRGPFAGQEDRLTDLIGVAAGGLLYLNGFPEDPPNRPFGSLAYRQVSHTLAGTATALLAGRRRKGKGGHVSVSLQEAVAMTTMQASNENLWRWRGSVATRSGLVGLSYPILGGGGTAMIRSPRATYRTHDGRWVNFSLWPAAWSAFTHWVADAAGIDRLLQPEWDDPLYRAQHRDQTDAAIEALCAALSRDELVETGQRLGLLVLPVNAVDDIAADEHLAARGFYRDVHHPLLGRSLRMPGSVFLSSNAPRPALPPAPGLGEHTVTLLEQVARLDRGEIDRMLQRGVAAAPAHGEPSHD